MDQQHNIQTCPPFIFWILWGSIFSGLFMMNFLIGSGISSDGDAGGAPVIPIVISLIVIVISILVRFFILPNSKSKQSLLMIMIIGSALAEGAGILSIVTIGDSFPIIQRVIFFGSVLGVALYIPFYANKPTPSIKFKD